MEEAGSEYSDTKDSNPRSPREEDHAVARKVISRSRGDNPRYTSSAQPTIRGQHKVLRAPCSPPLSVTGWVGAWGRIHLVLGNEGQSILATGSQPCPRRSAFHRSSPRCEGTVLIGSHDLLASRKQTETENVWLEHSRSDSLTRTVLLETTYRYRPVPDGRQHCPSIVDRKRNGQRERKRRWGRDVEYVGDVGDVGAQGT